jgi:hypothetical protein
LIYYYYLILEVAKWRMDAGDGETRLTRRALSEARSRGRTTTIENLMTGNPFAALSAEAVETGISDEDSGMK